MWWWQKQFYSMKWKVDDFPSQEVASMIVHLVSAQQTVNSAGEPRAQVEWLSESHLLGTTMMDSMILDLDWNTDWSHESIKAWYFVVYFLRVLTFFCCKAFLASNHQKELGWQKGGDCRGELGSIGGDWTRGQLVVSMEWYIIDDVMNWQLDAS